MLSETITVPKYCSLAQNKMRLKGLSKLRNFMKDRPKQLRLLILITLGVAVFAVAYLNESDDISCYNLLPEGDLPSAEDFVPPEMSIFFIETSCKRTLNSRQACAVESAARLHPGWSINVYFLSPVLHHTFLDTAFNSYANIRMLRLHLLDFVKGTPVEYIFKTNMIRRSKWSYVHTSDILRFVMLFKWPGIYMDLDMVVLRPLDDLGFNWVAREGKTTASVGIMAFSRDELGRFMANMTLKILANLYDGKSYSGSGPNLITYVLRGLCSVKAVTDMDEENCRGFFVHGPELFYPVPFIMAEDYFSANTSISVEPYTIHLWNHVSKKLKVLPESLYARYAEKYCPKIFTAYGSRFGND